MKTIILFFTAVIVMIFQSTIVNLIGIYNTTPDLTIIYLVFISLMFGPVAGVFSGFFIGMVQDIYSYEFMGATMITKSLLGYVIGLIEEEIIRLDLVTKVIILALCFYLHDFIYCLLIDMKSDQIINFIKDKSLWESIYTLVIGFIFFYLTDSFKRTHVQ